MTEVWTEARIEKLKKLYQAKYSFAVIAERLGGGISRNAAIGKAHRLGLHRGNFEHRVIPERQREVPPAPQEIVPRKPGYSAVVQKINQAKAKPERTAPFQLPRSPKIKPEPFVAACVEVVPLNIGLMDLTETTCRWPDGDTVITFCGHPAPDGPYCRQHTAIAFRPRYERKGVPHPAELGKHRGGAFGRAR